jgi:hypothetical protein
MCYIKVLGKGMVRAEHAPGLRAPNEPNLIPRRLLRNEANLVPRRPLRNEANLSQGWKEEQAFGAERSQFGPRSRSAKRSQL